MARHLTAARHLAVVCQSIVIRRLIAVRCPIAAPPRIVVEGLPVARASTAARVRIVARLRIVIEGLAVAEWATAARGPAATWLPTAARRIGPAAPGVGWLGLALTRPGAAPGRPRPLAA
jgi:hypothetical protein